jgi:L-alanine-DL-glutamate epimerase-like enolase superfamily enzyme
MNITKIEPIAVSLPMVKPVIMAGEEVRRADNVLVRLEAGSGLAGWGEAAAAPTMTGETTASMVAAVHHLAPALMGRAADDIGGALAAMDGRMFANHGAKAAIEIALHDLVGRATGRPAHALLGDKRRSRMTVLGVIGGGDLEGDLRDTRHKQNDGFAAFKIKVGVDTPARDAERTRRICALLWPGALISADANQGFSAEQAIAFVRAVAGCGLGFFEQPVAAGDLAGMAAVAAATDIAIGADEGIHSAADIRHHHERKAARGVSLKAIKLGGLRAVVEAARMCDRLGMQVNVSCKTGESSIACAAALHVAAVIPEIAWGLTLTNAGLSEDVSAHPIRLDKGCADVLDRPGLGIDVDEDRVRRHRVDIAARHQA